MKLKARLISFLLAVSCSLSLVLTACNCGTPAAGGGTSEPPILSTDTMSGSNDSSTDTGDDTGELSASQGLEYAISEDRQYAYLVGMGTCTDSEVVVASEYNGLPVTHVGGLPFNTDMVTSLVIPDSVKVIDNHAFNNCKNLSKITLGDNITEIGVDAFSSTAYYKDESNWEDDVLYIGKYLIKAKETLAGEYEIKNDTRLIANYAFQKCTALSEIRIPDTVKSIGVYAFNFCSGLIEIDIPDSVTRIDVAAFSDCVGLSKVTLGKNLEFVGKAFLNTAFYNDDSNWENGVLYCDTYLLAANPEMIYGEYSVKEGTTVIASGAFLGCTDLTTIHIPDTVRGIGGSAFYECKSLTGLRLPDLITRIESSTFYGCERLATMKLPKLLSYIGNYAFGTTGLVSIEIPDTVSSIGGFAFSNCRELAQVKLPKSLKAIPRYMFMAGIEMNENKEVEIYSKLQEIEIPSGVTHIGEYAFFGCPLQSVEMPDSVINIGQYAFNGCAQMKTLKLSSSVQKIGRAAFVGCENLSKIKIPNSVTEIGDGAFMSCTRILEVELSENLISIGDSAFAYCHALTRIEIPANVTSIGTRAFAETAIVEIVNRSPNVTFSEKDAIGVYNSDDEYTGSKLSNDNGFIVYTEGESKQLILYVGEETELVIPDYITSIYQAGAFIFVEDTLTTVVVSENITKLTSSAFDGCENLTTITLSNRIKLLGYYAFSGCPMLSTIIYEGTLAEWEQVQKETDWHYGIIRVVCIDGEKIEGETE